MKTRDYVFILTKNSNNEYIAVSENEEFIQKYIKQYFVYFKDTVSLTKLEGSKAINIYKSLQDYFIYPCGSLFLTQYELDYYYEFFNSNYFKITQMISTIPFLRNLLSLDTTELDSLNLLFMKMYSKCSTIETFMSSIEPSKFVKFVSVEPTQIFYINQYNDELSDKFKYVIENDH